jgi:hypothetical protein
MTISTRQSRVPGLEVLHEGDELLHAGERHGIVDRGADTADRPVPLELHHALLGRLGDELLLEIRALGQGEGHVHVRPHGLVDGADVVPSAGVDGVVEGAGLARVLLLDLGEAALREQVLEDETADVDGEAGRGVVEGGVVGVRLEVEHDGREGLSGADEVLAHDGDGDAGGPDVLLCAGVDDAEAGDVDGLGAEVGGHVGDEDARPVAGLRVVLELHAVDGLVGADVEEPGLGVLGDGVERREGRVLAVFTRPGDGGGGELLGLLEGLVAPGSGHDEVGRIGGPRAEVERDGGELRGGAALEEEHGVGVGHREERAQVGLGLLDGGVELLPAVAHLHDAHPGAVVVHQLRLRPLEHGERERRGTRREVVDAALRLVRRGGCGRGRRRHRRARDPGGADREADGRGGGGRPRRRGRDRGALEEEGVRRGGGGGGGGGHRGEDSRGWGKVFGLGPAAWAWCGNGKKGGGGIYRKGVVGKGRCQNRGLVLPTE